MLIDKKIIGKLAILEKTYDALRFAPVTALNMEIAETFSHLRDSGAADAGLDWKPVASGDSWGDSWSSAWFRGSVTVPESLDGEPVFLRAKTGAPEAQLIVDGVHRGVFDSNHPVRLLDLKAKAGQTYRIHIEGYAGHTYPGTQPFDQPIIVAGGASQGGGGIVTKNSRHYESVEQTIERADVSAFVFEFRALRQLMQSLDEHSLRRGRIQVALEQVFTLIYAKPAEADEDEWRAKLLQAREVMQPLLKLENGPTAPVFGIIGHSHIDTAWIWTVSETKRKLARTFSSVLALMDQYPEFRFTQSAAYHADVVRELYPEIFARIQQRVKEGRWEINGAMWIEPDCNIPSGEALVRQCLVGQRATREMFGVTSDTLWQPDVFGYSAALPQILQSCDVRYFCTTKLGWNDTNHFPYDTFVWQGIDGSSVLSHFNRIHCVPDPETLIGAWNQVQHPDVQSRRLITYGWGDGGGGPTAEMIEIARRVENLEGCPRVENVGISEFMKKIEAESARLPTWSGELYLELHRGTLTSIAAIKRGNRRCEFALRTAEFAATLAKLTKGAAYPADALLAAWKKLLLNQFHDILPGSSVAEVNDEAVETFAQCLSEANAVRDHALNAIAPRAEEASAVLLANDLSWVRSGELHLSGLPEGKRPVTNGAVQEVEDVDGRKILLVEGIELPALGYSVVPLIDATPGTAIVDGISYGRARFVATPHAAAASGAAHPFQVDGDTVETPHARVRFDESGQIVSFHDKAARRELVAKGGAFNAFLLGEDVPAAWDNWDIDRDQRLKLAPQNGLVSRSMVADGPLQLRIRQEYKIGRESTLTQDIVFHARTAQVDFDTLVDWREKYQFLKVEFALDVMADQARHEIQFGHLTRTTHDNTSYDRAQFDVCAHKWTDISEIEYGVAFLNESKYACTVKNGAYRLSLLKSGRHPDPRGDNGRHRFAYAMLPHQGGFSVARVVRPAYEFNVPITAMPVADAESESFSLATVDSPNIIVEAVKWAEEGDSFILRLYEAGKTGTHANVRFGVPVSSVEETNMLEEKPSPLAISGDSVSLYFRPFEIKTLRCVPVSWG